MTYYKKARNIAKNSVIIYYDTFRDLVKKQWKELNKLVNELEERGEKWGF